VIVVLGSINLDLVARVERLPRAGETLSATGFATSPGGKGANQALAARRAGADVALFGAVGRDAFGRDATRLLHADGVHVAVREIPGATTGVALIHVDREGENCITVVAGANASLRDDDVPQALLGLTTTVLLQLETPEAASLALARRARTSGARVVLNAAPAAAIDPAWPALLDVLVVNQTECERLASVLDAPADSEAFVRTLARRHRMLACVTLGARGAIAADGERLYRVPGLAVDAIDTVGAGDAFVGALAASLDANARTPRALARAACAGALACTREGAQASLPRAEDIEPHAMTLESRIAATPLKDRS
jgi:ribokinase